MTNWMTAAGIAFIAGGLATLICLRSVLFGGGTGRPEAEAAKRPSRRAVTQRSPAQESEKVEPRRRPAERPRDLPALDPGSDEDSGSLAAIGLADEDDLEPEPELAPIDEAEPRPAAPIIPAHRPPPDERATDSVLLDDEESRPIPVRRVDRTDRGYGDRVDGWVRPEYQDEPAAGEYWTPVPLSDLGLDLVEEDPEPSAKGYGWPTLVERLPPVPDYEPATGFDLTPVPAEPTEAVPVWPPLPADRRVRLPRAWSSRNEKPADNRFTENETAPWRRTGRDEVDQRFQAPTGEPERRRPRPRPRPRRGPDPDDAYRSRHSAEPPR